MSKYDFEVDLSLNTSTGIILQQIQPGSVVMEFGCAAGRMTRYMKEALGCQVYIVEYDEMAFQKALPYAADGVCDDIQRFQWVERFQPIRFDAILFVDVLEHLNQPEKVLRKAAELLKEDGKIFVSVPNVTHNDIVLKAVQEHFDYTETGLLDDTHVHFWGLENIKSLGAVCGLTVTHIDGTRCSTGDTEQNVPLGERMLLENILRERQAGEIYQFVFTMDKGKSGETVCTIGAPGINSHIYLDTGKGFNSEERIAFASAYSGNGSYIAHFQISDTRGLKYVRLDPVEYQGCVLRSISICQDGEPCQLFAPEGTQLGSGLYIPGDDPQIIAQVRPDSGPVTVDAEIILPGAEYVRVLEEYGKEGHKLLEQARLQFQRDREDLERVISGQKKQIDRQKKAHEEQAREISALGTENSQLRTDVCSYVLLTNKKEKHALALEQLLRDRECQIREQERNIRQLEQAVSYYQNLRVVRLRGYAARILRGIKRRIKRLLGREG